jgi:glycopeptide antibiotics resistance protein
MLLVFRITKLPDALRMHFNPRLQLIPFYGIQNDLFNSALNIVLFLPFGFFLPALWRQFFSFKNTLITAVCFTALIEISQLFCNRLTDINDIITNTTGALIGYGFLQLLIKPFPNLFQNEFKKRECLLIFAITFSVVFFLDPAIYNFLFYFKLLPSYYFKH